MARVLIQFDMILIKFNFIRKSVVIAFRMSVQDIRAEDILVIKKIDGE